MNSRSGGPSTARTSDLDMSKDNSPTPWVGLISKFTGARLPSCPSQRRRRDPALLVVRDQPDDERQSANEDHEHDPQNGGADDSVPISRRAGRVRFHSSMLRAGDGAPPSPRPPSRRGQGALHVLSRASMYVQGT